MPRKPRMYLPGIPCHVVQRGNDRKACFFAEDDYFFYLQSLKQACQKYQVEVHAYVLMTNHVHLLMTPSDEIGISRVMQWLGRYYVQYINKTYRRTGTLWEGRHKSSLINADQYLLSCYRYIELNPVNANMVEHPGDYQWSSYRWHAYGETDLIITDHPLYQELGISQDARTTNYRTLFSSMLDKKMIHEIAKSAQFSMPLGNQNFKEQIEQTLGRSIGKSRVGRPRKCVRTTLS